MEDYQDVSSNSGVKCTDRQRRRIINNIELNGISYAEIDPWNAKVGGHIDEESDNFDSGNRRSPLIFIYCFKSLAEGINEDNIVIFQNSREMGPHEIDILWAARADKIDSILLSTFSNDVQDYFDSLENKDKVVVLGIRLLSMNRSDYFLKIISSRDGNGGVPMPNFDSLLSKIRLPLEALCESSLFDCVKESASSEEEICEVDSLAEPILDYMAKDFESFLHLIKNRLRQIVPNWQDKSPADIEVMLLELVAYLGDHLSYFQDAVATEAYLGTARNRISIKRHGRLLDYYVHEGCNSRTFVHIEVSKELLKLPRKTVLFTEPTIGVDRKIATNSVVVSKADFDEIKNDVEVFETMYDTTLYKQNNSYSFYNWGEPRCIITRGSTKAYLKINNSQFFNFSWQSIPDDENESTKLLTFMRNRYDMTWLKDAKIKKVPTDDKQSLLITPNGTNPSDMNKLQVELILQKHIDDEDEETADGPPSSNIKRTPLAVLKLSSGEKVPLKTRLINQFAEGTEQDVQIQIPTLRAGDILAFEINDDPADYGTPVNSKSRCHVLKLTDVRLDFDRGTGVWYYEICFDNDPLPFTICSMEKGGGFNQVIGNLALADHGLTIADPEPLRIMSVGSKGKMRCPVDNLENKDLTYSSLLFNRSGSDGLARNVIRALSLDSADHSAVSMLQSSPENALPDIYLLLQKDQLKSELGGNRSSNFSDVWRPQKDLLNNTELTKGFAVEREQNGRIFLRFFDPYLSNKGNSGGSTCSYHGNSYYYHDPCSMIINIDKNVDTFNVVYRVGNGKRGNVGSYSIKHVLYGRSGVDSDDEGDSEEEVFGSGSSSSMSEDVEQSVIQVYNPIPALGGTDPEDVSFSREYIPYAFMKQQRAVTTGDYEKFVRELPEVQKTLAEIKWTGNWYTVFITIDPASGIAFNNELTSRVRNYLEGLRLTGYDTEIVEPIYVPIHIEMDVCIKPHYNKGAIQRILKQTFSNKKNMDGSLAFFHRDRWSFGDSLFLSNIYQTALNVEGVSSIDVILFKKWGKPATNELDDGHIQIGSHEIIILDNDASKPENGALVINVI